MWVQRIIERQNKVVITDRMWARLLSSTNQPSFLRGKYIVDHDNEEEEEPQTQQQLENSCSDDNKLVKKAETSTT